MKIIKILIYYFKQNLKVAMINKSDFIFVLISDILWGIVGIIVYLGIFNNVNNFNGYTLEQVIFIYGISLTSLGIYYIFYQNITKLPQYINEGELDKFITRPINTYFQIFLDKFYFDKSGDLVAGIGILLFISTKINIDWSILKFLTLIVLVLFSSLIYLGMFSIFSSLSFWIKDDKGMFGPLKALRIFSKYPVTIYGKYLRILLTWVIPYAFTSFYPSLYFLGNEKEQIFSLLTILVGLVEVIIGYFIWNKGILKYNSSGN